MMISKAQTKCLLLRTIQNPTTIPEEETEETIKMDNQKQ